MLAFSCFGTPEQSRHDAVARVETRHQIRYSHPNLDWRAVPVTGDMHQAELSFNHHIITSTLRIWPCLAVSSDGSVDEGGVDLMYRLKVKAIFLEGARDVILNENVTLGCQFLENFDSCGILE